MSDDSYPAAPRSKSRMGCFGAVVAIFLILAALVAFIFQKVETWPGRTARQARDMFAEVAGFQPRVTVNHRVIFEQTSQLLELVTVTRPTEVEREMEHQRFGSKKRLKLRGTYDVRVGFDLRKTFNLRITDANVVVEVPPPKILSVDQKEIEVLTYENGLWNKIQPSEIEEELRGLPAMARYKASETGLQKEALDSFAKQLKEKLGPQYNVEVRVRSGEPLEEPRKD